MPEVTLTPTQRALLVRLLRAAYPHPTFPDGPYERTADAVIAKANETTWDGLALIAGLDSLDSRAGTSFVDLDDEAAEQLLNRMADAPFFRLIRGVAVVSIYNDPDVWEQLGYEGASFDQGGYLNRGFNDLDWLPDPRVEEYDGPEQLVEVAPDDQPTTSGAHTSGAHTSGAQS